MKNLDYLHGLETAGKLGAECKTCTLAGCQADAWGEEVEDGENDRGDCGNDHDFLNIGDLSGDDNHRDCDGKTLEEVLDSTCQKFSSRETVHIVLYSGLIIYFVR